MGRGGQGGVLLQAGRERRPRRRSSTSSAPASPATSAPSTWCSSQPCRGRRPVQSIAQRSGKRMAMPDGARPAAASTGSVMRAEAITLRFGGVTALSGVSMEIRQSEILAVIGPNGAGKSCTLNCFNGFNVPQEGRPLLPRSGDHGRRATTPSPGVAWGARSRACSCSRASASSTT